MADDTFLPNRAGQQARGIAQMQAELRRLRAIEGTMEEAEVQLRYAQHAWFEMIAEEESEVRLVVEASMSNVFAGVYVRRENPGPDEPGWETRGEVTGCDCYHVAMHRLHAMGAFEPRRS